MTDDPSRFAGTLCGALTAVLVGALVASLGVALSAINSVFAVLIVVVVIAGSAPTLARYRRRPVWRWVTPGAAVGAAIGFLVLLVEVL